MLGTEGHRAIEINRLPVSGLGESFLEFLGGDSYPCVGAMSAVIQRACASARVLPAIRSS